MIGHQFANVFSRQRFPLYGIKFLNIEFSSKGSALNDNHVYNEISSFQSNQSEILHVVVCLNW